MGRGKITVNARHGGATSCARWVLGRQGAWNSGRNRWPLEAKGRAQIKHECTRSGLVLERRVYTHDGSVEVVQRIMAVATSPTCSGGGLRAWGRGRAGGTGTRGLSADLLAQGGHAQAANAQAGPGRQLGKKGAGGSTRRCHHHLLQPRAGTPQPQLRLPHRTPGVALS
mmetsp:Transcript_35533/g.70475  ORF Transcript_35533/g.70475 Transcript_35533/m.70475 type:complete len:169 (-) Transcript_35533:269-775(-)